MLCLFNLRIPGRLILGFWALGALFVAAVSYTTYELRGVSPNVSRIASPALKWRTAPPAPSAPAAPKHGGMQDSVVAKRGSISRMQTVLATAFLDDPQWKEF